MKGGGLYKFLLSETKGLLCLCVWQYSFALGFKYNTFLEKNGNISEILQPQEIMFSIGRVAHFLHLKMRTLLNVFFCSYTANNHKLHTATCKTKAPHLWRAGNSVVWNNTAINSGHIWITLLFTLLSHLLENSIHFEPVTADYSCLQPRFLSEVQLSQCLWEHCHFLENARRHSS